MQEFTIPLTPEPQKFNIFLSGIEYRLTVRWNDWAQSWWLEIDTPDGATNILTGIPILCGIDLLEPFTYMGFKGSMICYSNTSRNDPKKEELGITSNLLWVVLEDGD